MVRYKTQGLLFYLLPQTVCTKLIHWPNGEYRLSVVLLPWDATFGHYYRSVPTVVISNSSCVLMSVNNVVAQTNGWFCHRFWRFNYCCVDSIMHAYFLTLNITPDSKGARFKPRRTKYLPFHKTASTVSLILSYSNVPSDRLMIMLPISWKFIGLNCLQISLCPHV
jgi:hypothetical protein